MDYHELDGLKIFEMIEQGDQDACEALDELATARGLYNLQCVLDYEKILIGGGISQQPLLIQKIQAELDKIYQALPFAIPHVQVETCRYYNDSNLIGALYNFLIINKEMEDE